MVASASFRFEINKLQAKSASYTAATQARPLRARLGSALPIGNKHSARVLCLRSVQPGRNGPRNSRLTIVEPVDSSFVEFFFSSLLILPSLCPISCLSHSRRTYVLNVIDSNPENSFISNFHSGICSSNRHIVLCDRPLTEHHGLSQNFNSLIVVDDKTFAVPTSAAPCSGYQTLSVVIRVLPIWVVSVCHYRTTITVMMIENDRSIL